MWLTFVPSELGPHQLLFRSDSYKSGRDWAHHPRCPTDTPRLLPAIASNRALDPYLVHVRTHSSLHWSSLTRICRITICPAKSLTCPNLLTRTLPTPAGGTLTL
jgi:hypothetical protein